MDSFIYKGWQIIPTVLPTADHKWAADCDLRRPVAEGEDVFEGATMQFVRDTQDAALAAACEEARLQVDNILANPDIRLA